MADRRGAKIGGLTVAERDARRSSLAGQSEAVFVEGRISRRIMTGFCLSEGLGEKRQGQPGGGGTAGGDNSGGC
jgi:hypothetical protein